MGKVVKTVKKAVKKTAKAVGKAVKGTAKAVGAYGKAYLGVQKGLLKTVGSYGKAYLNMNKSLLKGDGMGTLTNAGTAMSGGSIDLTGDKGGIVNIDTQKYLAKAMGVDMSSSGLSYNYTPEKKRIGLLSQLRVARGMPGGGSYTETVKNPLGGTSGKTGK